MRRAHIVIDAEPDPASIARALKQLETEAQANGFAIGTGTGLDITIDTVDEWASELEERGIVLVPVSAVYQGPHELIGRQAAEITAYRPCVGIMLLNPEGLVWIGRRVDKSNDEGKGQWWQMPQGGIDKDEDAGQAALRELTEETTITSAEIIAEAPGWYNYDLPEHLIGKSWNGKYRGQTQKWFALRFTGDESEINLTAARPQAGIRPVALGADERGRRPDRAVQAASLRAGDRRLPASGRVSSHSMRRGFPSLIAIGLIGGAG